MVSSQEQLEQDGGIAGSISTEFIAARERKGVSIEEAAGALHIAAKHLRQIEAGQFGELPSRVFALGYLRSYARYVGLDEARAVAEYEALFGAAAGGHRVKPINSSEKRFEPSRAKASPAKWLVPLLLLVVAAGAAVWWTQKGAMMLQQQAPEAEATAPLTQPGETVLPIITRDGDDDPAPVDGEEAQVPDSEAEGSDEPLTTDTEQSEEALAPAVAGSEGEPDPAVAAPVIAETAAVEAAAKKLEETVAAEPQGEPVSEDAATDAVVQDREQALGQASLRISFNADCWVEVSDASGKVLVASVRNAERGVDVVGEAPLQVTLGALSSVSELTYNGEVVPLDSRGRGNVLRLTLPEQE